MCQTEAWQTVNKTWGFVSRQAVSGKQPLTNPGAAGIRHMLCCRTKGTQVHIGMQGTGQGPLPQAGVCADAT